MLYSGDLLSTPSRNGALDILKRQQLRTVIPHALPVGTDVAHKTGFYQGVRADVGIVYSPAGPYAVAIMAKDVTCPDRLVFDLSLAALSRAVYDTLIESHYSQNGTYMDGQDGQDKNQKPRQRHEKTNIRNYETREKKRKIRG